MDLNILWFILIGVLFTGYFFLEGFDFGVGILLPFVGKTDDERRITINSIGTFWDGNEVWLLTGGGAMFAAFPNWYATVFSGFYLPLFLILLALIFRGVAFEFRSKDKNPAWRSFWDWALFGGSLVPALLWGVAFANFVRGVPIDAHMNYVGGFWNLLNPFALAGGLTTLALFTLHGAVFLSLKTEGAVQERATNAAKKLWLPTVAVMILTVIVALFQTNLAAKGLPMLFIVLLILVAALLVGLFLKQNKSGLAFVFTGLSIVFVTIAVFFGLFPNVIVSSLNSAWSLTIYNASSTPYTLKTMSIIALIFVPIVLAYQGWTYWIFKRRVTIKQVEY